MRLSEVAERDAAGSVAEVYGDIRARLGLPFVNLIYRHMATRPGRLEAIWGCVASAVAPDGVPAAMGAVLRSMRADWLEPLPEPLFEEIGVDAEEQRLAIRTLDAYARANTINAVIVTLLLERTGDTPIRRVAAGPEHSACREDHAAEILPMQDLSALGAGRRAVVASLADLTAGVTSEAGIIPSIFRHFAHNPALLAVIWTALAGAQSRRCLAVWQENLRRASREDASRIRSFGGMALDAGTIDVLRNFSVVIPRMIGVGQILRRLLARP